MKKIIILGIISVSVLSIFLFFNKNEKSISAGVNEKNRIVLFGKVDSLDENDNENDNEDADDNKDADDNEGTWLENFIKSHRTPFSKVITK